MWAYVLQLRQTTVFGLAFALWFLKFLCECAWKRSSWFSDTQHGGLQTCGTQTLLPRGPPQHPVQLHHCTHGNLRSLNGETDSRTDIGRPVENSDIVGTKTNSRLIDTSLTLRWFCSWIFCCVFKAAAQRLPFKQTLNTFSELGHQLRLWNWLKCRNTLKPVVIHELVRLWTSFRPLTATEVCEMCIHMFMDPNSSAYTYHHVWGLSIAELAKYTCICL